MVGDYLLVEILLGFVFGPEEEFEVGVDLLAINEFVSHLWFEELFSIKCKTVESIGVIELFEVGVEHLIELQR